MTNYNNKSIFYTRRCLPPINLKVCYYDPLRQKNKKVYVANSETPNRVTALNYVLNILTKWKLMFEMRPELDSRSSPFSYTMSDY